MVLSSAPLFLSIETATAVSSVALFREKRLIGTKEIREGNTHAQLITVIIGELLSSCDVKPADLSAVAVSKGPGSYTGLRVGVSAAKGLCFALGLPLIGYGTLDALAQHVFSIEGDAPDFIIPMIDARRMEVYTQVFDGKCLPLGAPTNLIIEENAFHEWLEKGKVLFVGDGVAKCKSLLEKNPNAIIREDLLCTSTITGELIYSRFTESDFEDLVTFEPFYLKDFVATKQKKGIL